jgi:acyl transferase domain-containing protein
MNTGLEIAVIGMAGRFPGAGNIHEFRENLENGIESLFYLSEEESKKAGIPDEMIENPLFVRTRGGVLEGKRNFDAVFFGCTPQEAEVLNPEVRVFMECAWEALENAAYNPFTTEQLIGVYAGASSGFHWQALAVLSGKGQILGDFTTTMLTDESNLANRVSYGFNLKGPAVAMQTACSTSLVAIHMACQGLLNGECDIALAGGVTAWGHDPGGFLHQEGMINSPDGHCRAFDARAKGLTGGEGVGVVVLKPLEQAVLDRDFIYAVVKGTAINNDGLRKVGYTAPSVTGQADVIRVAMQVAEVEPESISYVETHGTATPLGDPVEIKALTRAFDTDQRGYCALGSVKTNVGHLDAAAGVAGFIKTVLALYHKTIPPSLHFEQPNPNIDFDNSPFYVNHRLLDWPRGDGPRRAGVSSFGIGGTNAHAILEEAPEMEQNQNPDVTRSSQLIVLSAMTETALKKIVENTAAYLKENPGANLADVAYALSLGRRAMPVRTMLLGADAAGIIDVLSSFPSVKTPVNQVLSVRKYCAV